MAIILVLVTALVAPFFIDWTVHRTTFEAYAEKVLGHKVTVLGEADLQILPSPSVTFTDVRVGGAEDPLLVVSRFQMRMELPPLLKGEFRILDMSLDRPHLTISLDEEGRPDWLTSMHSGGAIADLAADDVAFENITITDGAVTVVDARSGETHTLDDADLNVRARSLAGPYRIDGPVEIGGSRYSLSLATGRRQDNGSLRVKGSVTPELASLTASLDGVLSAEDGLPGFEGTFDLKGIEQKDAGPQVVWTAEGALEADTSQVRVPEASYHFGPEDRRSSFTGQMAMVFVGDRRFDLSARAKQIDLDRYYGGGPQQPADLKEAAVKVLELLRAFPVPEMAGGLLLDIPVVVAGGELLQEVRVDLETRTGGWHVSRLSGRLPGRTTLATEGDLVVKNKLSYRGTVSLNSDQPGAFAAWIGQGDGAGSTRINPVSLEGRLSLVDSGAALENMRLELGEDAVTGGLSYRLAQQGRSELGISAVADTLDLDQLEAFANLIGPVMGGDGVWDDTNVSLMLQARNVAVRGVSGEGLSLGASLADDTLTIDRLFARDLAGAEVDVSGRVDAILTAPVGSMTGRLMATDLTGLMTLLRSAFPDAVALDRVDRAADYLVPAEFDATFAGRDTGSGSAFDFKLTGRAGGVNTEAKLAFDGRVDDWRAGTLDLALSLQGPDGGQILRQLGLDILPVDDLGTGEVSLEASGKPEDGVEVRMSASSPAASLSADGDWRWQANREPNFALTGTLAMDDLAPFALLAGRVMPVMAGDIPVDLSYRLEGQGSEITLRDLSGRLGETTFSGSVSGNLQPAQGETNRRFKGDLFVSSLDLMGLSEMVIGSDQWASLGDGSSIWPSAAFGRALLSDADIALSVTAETMVIAMGDPARNVTTQLRLSPDELRLDDLSADYADGRLTGQLSLRRSGAEGAFSGRLKLEGADLSDVVWSRDERSVATGTLDLLADFEGAGRSVSAIIAGLNGGGTVKVTNGTLRGLNPQAFSLVMRAVDAGLELEDDRIRDVFLNHMEAGTLRFDTLEAALGILGGRISARNIAIDSEAASMFGSAQIDLNALSLDSDFSLTVDAGEEAVIGAEPQVGLLFKGDLDEPQRSVDVAPFTAYLTLRAFEREVERVERLQAEILERQQLARELKRQEEERARRVREQQEREEAARQAAEEAAAQENAEPAEAPAPDTVPEPEANPISTQGAVQGSNPADFADRIRKVLGEQGETVPAGGDAAGSSLKPLEPPQTVEDLLAREIGLPANILGDGDPVTLSPESLP